MGINGSTLAPILHRTLVLIIVLLYKWDMKLSSPDSTTKHKPTKRKRGAQPGNSNALKHGLYARYFTRAEMDALKNQTVLDAEIEMLRVAIQRLFSRTVDVDEKTLAASLNALARASASLARIIETNQRIRGQDNGFLEAINLAVSRINKELSTDSRDQLP